MPVCCVPNCRTGYAPSKKFPNRITLPLFRFPSGDDDEARQLRSSWIQEIPRQDWSPNNQSRVCSAHFRPEEVLQEEVVTVGTDKVVSQLIRPKLVNNAASSIFTGLHSSLPSC